jgi:hypothetical protein
MCDNIAGNISSSRFSILFYFILHNERDEQDNEIDRTFGVSFLGYSFDSDFENEVFEKSADCFRCSIVWSKHCVEQHNRSWSIDRSFIWMHFRATR